MIRLSRTCVKCPADWEKTVATALPDTTAYRREAGKFEKLDLNCKERRAGFAKYAPGVLKNQRGKASFPAIWSEAKEGLAEMSYHKCAYCEAEITSTRLGQVEHFKPKSLFPSLAYDWRNYFLACGGCNGAKLDKWPKNGCYLRPDECDPCKKLRFEVDGEIAAVGAGADAKQTIEDFDLNRAWLVRHRKRHINVVVANLRDAAEVFRADKKLGLRLARDQLKQVSEPAQVYSAALKQCFLREWKTACPGGRL